MRKNPAGSRTLVRWVLDMLCAISGGNWNNGSNAGVWALNLNNDRGKIESIVSRLGHARRTKSLPHILQHLKENHHALFVRLPQTHHRNQHA